MYAHFYYAADDAGYYAPILGTDGYLPLDNRCNMQTHIMTCAKHARSLRKVKPSIGAFRIFHGKLSFSEKHERPATGMIPVRNNENQL